MAQGDQFEVKKIVKKSGSSFYWGMKILPNKLRSSTNHISHKGVIGMVIADHNS